MILHQNDSSSTMTLREDLAEFVPLSDYRGFITMRGGDDNFKWAEVDLEWINENMHDLLAETCEIAVRKRDDIGKNINSVTDWAGIDNGFDQAFFNIAVNLGKTFDNDSIDVLHGHFLALEQSGKEIPSHIISLHDVLENVRTKPFSGKIVELTPADLFNLAKSLKEQTIFKKKNLTLDESLEQEVVKDIDYGMKYIKQNVISWYVDDYEQRDENQKKHCHNTEAYEYINGEIVRMQKALDHYRQLLTRFPNEQ